MAALGSAHMVSTGGGSSVLGIFVSVLLNLVPGMYERCVCSKPCAILVVAVGTHCCVHESTASARHVRYKANVLRRASYLTTPSHHTWQAARGPLKGFMPTPNLHGHRSMLQLLPICPPREQMPGRDPLRISAAHLLPSGGSSTWSLVYFLVAFLSISRSSPHHQQRSERLSTWETPPISGGDGLPPSSPGIAVA